MSSIEITLRMPDSVIRKIRAYAILSDKDVRNFESVLVEIVEQAVSDKIMEVLEDSAPHKGDTTPKRKLKKLVDDVPLFKDDVSGISEGLGDDDESEEPDDGAERPDPYLSDRPVSKKKAPPGLTDEELAADMDVEDPQHEAKSEPSESNDGEAEDVFAQVAGLPTPPKDFRAERKAQAQARAGKRRAKVRPMTENEG